MSYYSITDPFQWTNFSTRKSTDSSGSVSGEGTQSAGSAGLGQAGSNFRLLQEETMYNPVDARINANQTTSTDLYAPTKTYSPVYSFVYGSGTSSASGANVNPSFDTSASPTQTIKPSLTNKPSQAQSAEQGQSQGMSSPIESLMILAVVGVGGFILIKSGALKKIGKKGKK